MEGLVISLMDIKGRERSFLSRVPQHSGEGQHPQQQVPPGMDAAETPNLAPLAHFG